MATGDNVLTAISVAR
jgi:magnesium-transporting ATPase (P-type)